MAEITSYRHDAPRQPDYDLPPGLSVDSGSTIANVLAFDCTFNACEIRECYWENVTLRNCKMTSTRFLRMTLTNVIFANVDFDELRLQGIWLDNVDWQDMAISHLMVDLGLKMQSPFPLYEIILPILPMDGFPDTSKTRAWSGSSAWPPISEQEPSVVRKVVLGYKRPATLLQMPQHIFDRIIQLIFPQREMFVYDIPCSTSHTSYYWRTNYILHELKYGGNRITWAISTAEVAKDDDPAILAATTASKP
ncbi:hypothetical protein LTR86_009282 [Recurvomyces mirabilis]|nr:hypothetical protein LTR86_009282 [Recurvomyces mirabilis]